MVLGGGAFGRGSTLMNGISALVKKTLLFSLCEVTVRKLLLMKGILTRHQIYWHHDLGLACLRNYEK